MAFEYSPSWICYVKDRCKCQLSCQSTPEDVRPEPVIGQQSPPTSEELPYKSYSEGTRIISKHGHTTRADSQSCSTVARWPMTRRQESFPRLEVRIRVGMAADPPALAVPRQRTGSPPRLGQSHLRRPLVTTFNQTLFPASLTTLPLSFPSQLKRTRKPGHTPRITAHRRQSYTHILPRASTSPFDPATPPKRLPTARTAAALPRAPPRTTPATPTPPPPGSRPSPLCLRPVWEVVSAARRRHLRRRGSLAQ